MRSRATLAACVLLLSRSAAYADPIVVTGGSITVAPSSAAITLSLLGSGLELNTSVDSDSRVDLRFCFPCTADQPLSFNARLSDIHGGNAGTVNGVFYPTLYLEGFWEITAPPVIGALTSGLTVTAPFTFAGPITGYARDNISGHGGPILFSETLIGRGTATANFNAVPVDPGFPALFTFHDAVYRFESTPSPTPEPATLFMLGVGFASISTRSRFRR
jgi:hypothetical protein